MDSNQLNFKKKKFKCLYFFIFFSYEKIGKPYERGKSKKHIFYANAFKVSNTHLFELANYKLKRKNTFLTNSTYHKRSNNKKSIFFSEFD